MKQYNRVFAPSNICKNCKHKMLFHDRTGCRRQHCICKNTNVTFRELIHSKKISYLFTPTIKGATPIHV